MTRRTYEEPVRTAGGPHDDYDETHPAYGMIGASRVTSTPGAALFGSDFAHGNYVVIRVSEGGLSRGLSHDYYRGGSRPILEVAVSEAQWATFVSSMNVGNGVPCTIEYREQVGLVPGIVPITNRRVQLDTELRDTVRDAMAALREVIDDPSVPKKTRDRVAKARQEIEQNLPFVMKSFDEHAETTVERAKMEVNAYVTGAIQRAGLTALGAPVIAQIVAGDDTP